MEKSLMMVTGYDLKWHLLSQQKSFFVDIEMSYEAYQRSFSHESTAVLASLLGYRFYGCLIKC